MTPAEFGARLRTLAQEKGLTASDLTLWLGRPRPTIRTWLNGSHTIRDSSIMRECARRLELLAKCSKLPPPHDLSQRARRAYIDRAYHDADNKPIPCRYPTL